METVESVAKWADETFGPAAIVTMYERVLQEWEEMRASRALGQEQVAEEMADVIICLYRLIYHLDPQAIEKKMAVNRARQWHIANGVGQHK